MPSWNFFPNPKSLFWAQNCPKTLQIYTKISIIPGLCHIEIALFPEIATNPFWYWIIKVWLENWPIMPLEYFMMIFPENHHDEIEKHHSYKKAFRIWKINLGILLQGSCGRMCDWVGKKLVRTLRFSFSSSQRFSLLWHTKRENRKAIPFSDWFSKKRSYYPTSWKRKMTLKALENSLRIISLVCQIFFVSKS